MSTITAPTEIAAETAGDTRRGGRVDTLRALTGRRLSLSLRNPRAILLPLATRAASRLARTRNGRGIGAASRSGWAPLLRSTITPSPACMALSGTTRPAVPMAR